MKQTLEEATKEAIHAHYNCNGKYPCGERNYCQHCNGHNTAYDCCEYFPSDGVCLTTTDVYVCPATAFFGVIKEKGKISQSEFKSICV